MSGPSDKAVEAAAQKVAFKRFGYPSVGAAKDGLIAAHDPALGLDRSVCLRDVVEALERYDIQHDENAPSHADFIEREFGGGS